jgi:hypothetical protein
VIRRLHSLEPAEVSLVPRGANKKKFIIFKSALEAIQSVTPEQMAKVEAVLKAYIATAKEAPMPTVDPTKPAPAAGAPAANPAAAPALSPQAQAALKAVARILAPFKEEITDELVDQVLESIGISEGAPHDEPGTEGAGKAGLTEDEEEEEGDEGEVDKGSKAGVEGSLPEASDEEKESAHSAGMDAYMKAVKSHVRKLGKGYPDAEARIAKTDGKTTEPVKKEGEGDMGIIMKSDGTIDLAAVPEKLRPEVEAIFKTQMEAVTKAASLEKEITELKASGREKEIVAKAEEFKHIALDKAELVKTLKLADKAGKEDFDRVCKQFEALDKQAEKGKLFEETGSDQTGNAGADISGKIDAAVDGIVKKSGGTISKEQAYTDFITSDEGRKLYAEHQKNRKGGI